MTRTLMVALVAWIALANLVLSNGGTFAVSSVRSSGNLQPVQKSKITLDREDLSVAIKGDYADVTVDYRLINRGRKETVLFGFPVDQLSTPLPMTDREGIHGYQIEDNGNALPFSQKVEPLPEAVVDNLTEQRYTIPTQRTWYLSEITFARGETKHLRMTYRVRTFGTTTGTTKQAFWIPSKRSFSYTFKPAATWGDGKVRELNIILDLNDLSEAESEIKIPSEFSKQGELWIARHENFDLRTAKDLNLTYDHSDRLLHDEILAKRLDPKWIESIRASSTHPAGKKDSYTVKNLLDGNRETAWIEGVPGVGIGEWIEIVFKKGVRVQAIGILNGYCKNQMRLHENGQVLQCQVEYQNDNESDELLIPLNRTEWKRGFERFPASQAQWIYDQGDINVQHNTRKVRITITGAEQGNGFSDTAISELYICGSRNEE